MKSNINENWEEISLLELYFPSFSIISLWLLCLITYLVVGDNFQFIFLFFTPILIPLLLLTLFIVGKPRKWNFLIINESPSSIREIIIKILKSNKISYTSKKDDLGRSFLSEGQDEILLKNDNIKIKISALFEVSGNLFHKISKNLHIKKNQFTQIQIGYKLNQSNISIVDLLKGVINKKFISIDSKLIYRKYYPNSEKSEKKLKISNLILLFTFILCSMILLLAIIFSRENVSNEIHFVHIVSYIAIVILFLSFFIYANFKKKFDKD